MNSKILTVTNILHPGLVLCKSDNNNKCYLVEDPENIRWLNTNFNVVLTDNGMVSRRKYISLLAENINIGDIVTGTISKVESYGIFYQAGDITIFVPEIEVSRCFLDLKKSFYPGIQHSIMITKKEFDEAKGITLIFGSRKQADTSPWLGKVARLILLGKPLNDGSGFFCEVTPSKSGIIDFTPNQIEMFQPQMGDRVIAIMKKNTSKGLKLNFINYPDLINNL